MKPPNDRGKQLVPRAEASELAIDVDAERAGDDLAVTNLAARREPFLHGQRRTAEERRPLGELAGEIELTGLDLAAQLVLPRREPVGPRHDRERPAAGPIDHERPAEAIVAEVRERLLAHLALRRPRAHRGAEDVVPVDEDGRVDVDPLARRALDGEAPAVDLRLDRLDLDPGWRLRCLRQRHQA